MVTKCYNVYVTICYINIVRSRNMKKFAIIFVTASVLIILIPILLKKRK